MYPSVTLINVKPRIFGYNQIWKLFIKNFLLINNRIEKGSESKYFPLIARDPVQRVFIQALGTQNSLKKIVSFAMKYVYAIPMLTTRKDGEFMNSKVHRSVYGCCKCNWRNK